MTRKFVFVDEAGNFDFSTRGSRFFILTSVTVESCDIGHELLALRRAMGWRGLPLKSELHATEDSQIVRDEVFNLLEAHSFRVDATIFEKRKINPRLREDHTDFYGFAWFHHTRYVIPRIATRDDEVHMIGATFGTRKQQSIFQHAIARVMRQVANGLDIRPSFWSAASEPCLQVADYCCWAIQRKWERGDQRSHALITPKIQSEFDVFETEAAAYY